MTSAPSARAHRPQIIAVLDIMGGVVVRGVGGRRDEYRPLETPLASAPDPLLIAQAIRNRFGIDDLYVADLDAIRTGRPALHTIAQLADAGFQPAVDAGVASAEDVRRLMDAGAHRVIAALETSRGPEHLAILLAAAPAERLVFSLDLKLGRPMVAADAGWNGRDALQIAAAARAAGAASVLVLDLAAVGENAGLSTLPLCRNLRRHAGANPFELWTGGGVRDHRDLQLAADAGVDAVLVASALHNGRLTPGDWA